MSVEIVPYAPDLAPTAIALWNRALGGRFPLTERLWRQNVEGDPNWRPGDGIVARRAGGTVVGFAITRLFRESADPANADMAAMRGLGWVMALAVAPEDAGRGIGGRLLAAAEARLRREGATRCDLGGSVAHLVPGPPADDERATRFWARHGYRPERRVHDLVRTLADWTPPATPPALSRGDWRVGPARAGQEGAILDFVARAFPGRWRYLLADTFARGGAVEDVIVLEDRAGMIAGFLLSGHWRGRSLGPPVHWFPALGARFGGIGPLGIAKTARGQGLGLALVAAGVDALRARDVERCLIDWTDLTDFYGRLGFRVAESYWRCAPKALGGEVAGGGR